MTSSRWALRLGCALATGLAAWVFTAWVGLRPRPALVVLLTMAGFAVAWVVAGLAGRIGAIDWAAPRRRFAPRHGLDPRFSRLARSLRDDLDQDSVAQQVHGSLVRIIDDRLLARHDIDRRTNPAAANAVLDPVLIRYVDEMPQPSRSQTAHLHDIVKRIEAL